MDSSQENTAYREIINGLLDLAERQLVAAKEANESGYDGTKNQYLSLLSDTIAAAQKVPQMRW